ncbi:MULTISPECIES: hypothetical protein [unclassified Duganella]|uniref:hypothetical protein n=1 Tax=unclassified Duganella TaxID=2636909 RepID=UPI0006F2214B|nr:MULTISPECIES: hypothetical protein [unclassified Duganella]KQV59358.1 hypothetical protein ASD07_24385 [Duganella sp. Root336D2]KRC01454.1 hypothetical protein ASE26_20750 [Duganella sp. Root198D2]
MRALGVGNALPSFWSQLSRFFAYPFALNGLLFLALLAGLASASAMLFDPQSIQIFLPIFIVVALAVRQGLRVIEFCSQGRAQPPSIPELFDGNPTTLKMFGLMLGYGIAVGCLGHFGLLGFGLIICLSGLLPASIMLLAIHGSLRDALDPIQVFQLALRIGWSYFGLLFVLFITAQGPERAIGLLPATTLRYLAEHYFYLLIAIPVVVTVYFNMVMGAMMGYLLFQHHEDLGIEPDDDGTAAPADYRALELARAVILVRESRYPDALKHMAGMVADYPNDLQVLEYHHKLLCQSRSEPERIQQHTERYLQVLLDMQRKNRMTAVLEAACMVVPHYKPKSIALRRALAEEYFAQKRFNQAIALIGMLHKEAPTSEELPAAYYLLARIYSEGLRDDGKAVMILDFLLKQHAGHAIAGEVGNYRKVILSLGQMSQAAV